MTKHETSPVLLGFASTLEFVAEETAAKRISKREIQIYNVNHIVISLNKFSILNSVGCKYIIHILHMPIISILLSNIFIVLNILQRDNGNYYEILFEIYSYPNFRFYHSYNSQYLEYCHKTNRLFKGDLTHNQLTLISLRNHTTLRWCIFILTDK